MYLSVLIPAYNEAAIIERCLFRVREHLDAAPAAREWELVVVDDGSSDGTGAIVDAVAAADPRVRALHHGANLGLGAALKTGFEVCRGEVIVTLDADLTYSVEHIDRLVEAYAARQAAIVIASPYMSGGEVTAVPRSRLLTSRVANRLLAAASNARLSTYTGMVRAYDAGFVRGLTIRANGMEVNAEILRQAQILRARIVEIPAHLDWGASARAADPGRFRFSGTTLSVAISTFLFRPVMFFMLPGLALLVLACIGFGLAVARGFGGPPLIAALASLAAVAGIQLLGFAVLALQLKRSFEDLFGLASATYRQFREGTRP